MIAAKPEPAQTKNERIAYARIAECFGRGKNKNILAWSLICIPLWARWVVGPACRSACNRGVLQPPECLKVWRGDQIRNIQCMNQSLRLTLNFVFHWPRGDQFLGTLLINARGAAARGLVLGVPTRHQRSRRYVWACRRLCSLRLVLRNRRGTNLDYFSLCRRWCLMVFCLYM